MLKRQHHPGITLGTELRERRVSLEDFSKETGIAYYRVWNFINGKRKLTLKEIDRVAIFIGNSPNFWRNLQRNYYSKDKG